MRQDLTFKYSLTPQDKAKRFSQIPKLIWITGLSASGKSTLADQLDLAMHQKGYFTTILDGDKLRAGLNAGLGFSEDDRKENLRRTAEVASMFLELGFIVIGAFISPKASDRELVRSIVGEQHFIEIFLDVSIELCEKRDPKGLYAKARQGLIQNFTGVDQPYEKPLNSSIIFEGNFNIQAAVEVVIKFYEEK